MDRILQKCCSELATAVRRLELVAAHDALVLLRSSFSAPKLQYILRCSPCYGHEALTTFDNLLRIGVTCITNCDLSDVQWLQASLPVRDGGLGIRRVTTLALSAYMASAAGTLYIQDQILSQISNIPDVHVISYLRVVRH